jgi:hypothetical protein
MTQDERVQYKFMIPKALKQELEEAAGGARRSLSAEIILRLYESLADMPEISEDPVENELYRLEGEKTVMTIQIADLKNRLSAIDEDIAVLSDTVAKNRNSD